MGTYGPIYHMNSAIDVNSKATVSALLKTDARTIIRLVATSGGTLFTTTNISGAITPRYFASTDENSRPTLFAVSENDGETPVTLQCDTTGALLIKFI